MNEQNKNSKGLFNKFFGSKPDIPKEADPKPVNPPIKKKNAGFGSLKLQYKTNDTPKGPKLRDIRSNLKPTAHSKPVTRRLEQDIVNRSETRRVAKDSISKTQRPVEKKMSQDMVDFDTFRKQRLNAKNQTELPQKIAKPSNQRYKMKKGLTGGGSKYQDHKLGKGLDGSMPVGAGNGAKYQNHKIADALNGPKPVNSGNGAKYQDHRLGNALKGPRPVGAGGGSKYQDHKHGGCSQR